MMAAAQRQCPYYSTKQDGRKQMVSMWKLHAQNNLKVTPSLQNQLKQPTKETKPLPASHLSLSYYNLSQRKTPRRGPNPRRPHGFFRVSKKLVEIHRR